MHNTVYGKYFAGSKVVRSKHLMSLNFVNLHVYEIILTQNFNTLSFPVTQAW